MSNNTYYCNMKGIGWMLLIVTFLMVGVPMLMTYVMVGHEDYGSYCKMTPALPCFGVGDE